MNLSGKTALVTGGGSGIGLAISQALIAEGATVIACGRTASKLEKAKAAVPKLHTEVCDVTNNEQLQALAAKCESEHGGVDILVNNAGVFKAFDYKVSNPDLEQQLQEVEIDLNGPIRVLHFFLPQLKQKPEAALVNVSSGLAFVPLALAPVYSATKAGLHAWTQSLRFQHAGTSLKVFELMPPLVRTEMVSRFEGAKMMEAADLASAFIKGLKSNTLEITPGQSSQLRMMRRLAPGFIFNAVNKQFLR